MRGTNTHTRNHDDAGKILPRLSEIARDPVVRAFFRRGENGQSPFGAVTLTPPLKPAPAAAEMEVA